MKSKIADLEKRIKELEDYVYNLDDFLPARSLVEKTKNYLEKLENITVLDLRKRFHIPEARARKLVELFISYGFLTKNKNDTFKINKEAYYHYEEKPYPITSGGDHDPLYEAAKEIVCQLDKVSTSLIQRRLSLGYARACRVLDQLEAEGIIGPAVGSKPREVLKKS